MLSVANPESGTISYTYDNNGNLTSKVDARSITTSYTYDAQNRVTQRAYAAPSPTPSNYSTTPTVTYTYDNKTNAYGRLTKVSSSVSTTEYTAFDILGRVTAHKQTTDAIDYTTAYTYSLTGALLTETYPSGRVVKNTFAGNGDLSQVESKPSGGSYTNRATSFVYNPAGAVQSLALGSGKYEWTKFNARLQPTEIALGTSTSDYSLLRLQYGYGTTANNGNVVSQEITVPGVTHHFIQNYTYDSLNRLEVATETYNGTQEWKQEWSYDRYGNRNFVTGTGKTTTLGSCTTMCNPTFSSTTNRISSSGYSYDSSGNTTADPDGRSFIYDGENKQTKVTSGGSDIGTYSYDGDGKRVKKTVPGAQPVTFLYDAMGRLVEEYVPPVEEEGGGGEGRPSGPSQYSVFDPTPILHTSYVYAGGRLLSTETVSGTTYLTADHLGTPRINTDASGSVIARHDYMPFGEKIATSQRIAGVGYAADGLRKQFARYERDDETGLDFAQARYFGSPFGRFEVPDPENAGADEREPQSWNGYSYVINNPLSISDPDGLAYVRKNDQIYWVDDTLWDNCQKDAKCKDRYKDYEYLPYGTQITVSKDEKGEFYALAGEKVILREGRKLEAVRKSGSGLSPYQIFFNGTENTMRVWRMPIYVIGTGVMIIPAATPVAFGIGGGLASAAPLGIHLSRAQIIRQFIGAGQKRLLDQFFKTGIVSNGLTVRTVMWATELCRKAIAEGRDVNGAQTMRLKQLQELFDKMTK